MKVELPVIASTFDALQPGDMFWFIQSEDDRTLCVKVALEDMLGTILFSRNEKKGGLPWLSVEPFPKDTILKFPELVIRPNWRKSIPVDLSSPSNGAILIHDSKTLLRTSAGVGRNFLFNLETGLVDRSSASAGLFYPEWSAGLLLSDKFEEVYRFPG